MDFIMGFLLANRPVETPMRDYNFCHHLLICIVTVACLLNCSILHPSNPLLFLS